MKRPWMVKTVWCNNEQESDYLSQHKPNAFVNGLKPVVFIGRLFGVLSRSDILSTQEVRRRLTFPAMYTGILSTFFFVNAILFTRAYILTLKTQKSTSDKLAELCTVGYAWTMFFLYVYLLFATKRFRNIVQKFITTQGQQTIQLSSFTSTFPIFCWIILTICLVFGIAENILYDVQNLSKRAKVNATGTIQAHYLINFHHWSELVPYHPILTVILFVIVKVGTWGWVFGDVIPIVLTKAMTEKLKRLDEEIQLIIAKPLPPEKTSALDKSRASNLLCDAVQDEFMTQSKLALEIQKFIAPLIMSCYGGNVYTIMVNVCHTMSNISQLLFLWISPNPAITLEQSHYVYFAFLNFLFRVTSVTYFAAEVHHTSSSIQTTIQRCPNSLYTLSLERLEHALIFNPIGIRLFGSFMITRKSFLSIISFLFTTEIVLLQTVKD